MAAFIRMQQARKVWGRFSHLLHQHGASVETMGRFYRTVIQQTLLFGSETWVLSARALNRLERFHARCARGIAHRPIRRRSDGTWNYPATDGVLTLCGLQPLSVYIERRRHTLFQRYAEKESSLFSKGLSLLVPQAGTWWKLAS